MATLLMHSPDLPAEVREALQAAHRAAPDQRTHKLKAAARLLHHQVDVPCPDARELVGLPASECGC